MTSTFRPFLFLALVLSLCGAALAQAGAAGAQQPQPQAPAPQQQTQQPAGPPPTKIGIINIQQAILATEEGKREFGALEKKFEPKRGELQKMQTELEDLRKQLTTQGDKLSDQARNELVRNIEQRERRLRTSLEDAQSDFQTEQNQLANRIGSRLLQVLDQYATKNGYLMILDVSNPQTPVLWANSDHADLTQELVAAYNAQPPAAPSTQQRPSGAAGTTPPQRPSGATGQATPQQRPPNP